MTQSAVVTKIEADVRSEAWQAATKVASAIMVPAAVLGLIVGAITPLGAVKGWVLLCLLALPAAIWAVRRSLRQGDALLDGRYALLINRWIDAARDPAEAQRRRELLWANGVRGTVPFIDEQTVRDIRVQTATKTTLRQTVRRKLLLPDGPGGAGLPAQPYAGMYSGSGLPIGPTGTDVLGDLAGSTATRDFLSGPAHNPNTEQWTAAGTYTPPT